jgi:hypothetical protein
MREPRQLQPGPADGDLVRWCLGEPPGFIGPMALGWKSLGDHRRRMFMRGGRPDQSLCHPHVV